MQAMTGIAVVHYIPSPAILAIPFRDTATAYRQNGYTDAGEDGNPAEVVSGHLFLLISGEGKTAAFGEFEQHPWYKWLKKMARAISAFLGDINKGGRSCLPHCLAVSFASSAASTSSRRFSGWFKRIAKALPSGPGR